MSINEKCIASEKKRKFPYFFFKIQLVFLSLFNAEWRRKTYEIKDEGVFNGIPIFYLKRHALLEKVKARNSFFYQAPLLRYNWSISILKINSTFAFRKYAEKNTNYSVCGHTISRTFSLWLLLFAYHAPTWSHRPNITNSRCLIFPMLHFRRTRSTVGDLAIRLKIK